MRHGVDIQLFMDITPVNSRLPVTICIQVEDCETFVPVHSFDDDFGKFEDTIF